MGKAISIIVAVLATAMLFSGCQTTPDEPVVVGKDMEQMLEKAQDETPKGMNRLVAARFLTD